MTTMIDFTTNALDKEIGNNFNLMESASIRFHQQILCNWANLAYQMNNHITDDSIIDPMIESMKKDSNSSFGKEMPKQDFMDQIINNKGSANTVLNDFNDVNNIYDEEDSKMEVLEEDDDDDFEVISTGINSNNNTFNKNNDHNNNTFSNNNIPKSNLNAMFKSINKHLTVPSKIQRQQQKLAKKYIQSARNCRWNDNALIVFLTHLMLRGERFTVTHLGIVLEIFCNLDPANWSEFFNGIPANLTEFMINAPSNATNNVVLGLCVENPQNCNDSVSDQATKSSKATKQKYLKHYMSKISLAERIKMDLKNINKQQFILNGIRRRKENDRKCQLVLDDLALIDNKQYQVVPFDDHIRMQAPAIFQYGHYCFIPNMKYPHFPIIAHTGCALAKCDHNDEIIQVMYVMKVWKNKAIEIDNVSNNPSPHNKKKSQLIERHTVVYVNDDWKFDDEDLEIIKNNDGTIFPCVLLEGISLQLNSQLSNATYCGSMSHINQPTQTIMWNVTLHNDKYYYRDFHLSIDQGKQMNYAIKRKDYPGDVETICWNYNNIESSNKCMDVLQSFDFASKYVKLFRGCRSLHDPFNCIIAKFVTLWTDDFVGHNTANYNESIQVTAYRMNDEPNNEPHALSLKYAHAGHSIMSNAYESELLRLSMFGIVGKYADPVSRKLVSKMVFPFVILYAGDRPARQKITRDAGHKATHSNPQVLGKPNDLSLDGQHRHQCRYGYLPDSSILKTNGFFDVAKTILAQMETPTQRLHLQRAMSTCSAFYKIDPTFKYIDDKGLFCCDDFHMGPGGILRTAIQSTHYLITDNDPILTQIWNRLYHEGSTTTNYQSIPNMSCFQYNKAPNKFIHVYGATFQASEATALVSLKPQFMSQIDDSQRQRNIQEFYQSLHWILSVWGRIHSRYSDSRLFQKNYIENVLVSYGMKLQAIQELIVASPSDSTCDNKNVRKKRKSSKQKRNKLPSQQQVQQQVQQQPQAQVANVSSVNNINMTHVTHSSLQFLSNKMYQNDDLTQVHSRHGNYHFVQHKQPNVRNNNTDNNNGDTKQQFVDDDFVGKIEDILHTPNFRSTIELTMDGYTLPMCAADCRAFEMGLQRPKRMLTISDQRFNETLLVKQMLNLNKQYIWDDFYSNGGNNSMVISQDRFKQYLSSKVKSCMFCCVLSMV